MSSQIRKSTVINLDKALGNQFDASNYESRKDEGAPDSHQRDMDIVFKELNMRKTQILQAKVNHDRDMKILKQYVTENLDKLYA